MVRQRDSGKDEYLDSGKDKQIVGKINRDRQWKIWIDSERCINRYFVEKIDKKQLERQVDSEKVKQIVGKIDREINSGKDR